ncbi:hypothetical protein [Bounagaea algeriensis]
MTVLDDRPRNGAPQSIPVPSTRTDTPNPSGESSEPGPDELQAELDREKRSVAILRELTDVENQGAFLQRRDGADDEKDQKASRRVRNKERREKERAGKAQVRAQRLARWRAWLDDRAERTRQRLTDPARAVGTIHRTWTVCAALMISIITGALLYLTHTVKLGVVGPDGSWLGYAIEPIASAMLVISLALQTRAYRQGSTPGKLFIAIDIGLCAASIVLVTVPWGLRFGWGGPDTLVHIIVPVLVAFGVLLWHAGAALTADMLRTAKHDPVLEERIGILRHGIATGDLPADPSKSACERHLRQVLRGINREDANKAIRHFLGK